MEESEPHFVFCINANDQKTDGLWMEEVVQRQLKGYGVMQALKVLKYSGLFLYGFVSAGESGLRIPNEIIHLIAAFSGPEEVA